MIQGFYRVQGIPIALNELLRILFKRSQSVQDKIWTTVPTTKDLQEGEEAYYDDGTNRRKYVKLNGVIRVWVLT